MTAIYIGPKQARSKITEQKFLDALQELLMVKSLSLLTIDEIADQAKLTRSAFLKRFGTKNQALMVLYERYCNKVMVAIEELAANLDECKDAVEACYRISKRAEALQLADFSANRAMHELFSEQLVIAPQTKALFTQCCVLMKEVQTCLLPPSTGTSTGVFAATQLLFTINYNHVLKAMPGLPRDPETRHRMIANIVSTALRQ
jgi:AcrR family transcriptional regulator